MTINEWFTVDEAAEYLRVSRRTIYKLTKDGRLPAFRIGQERHRRFRKEDLDKVPRASEAVIIPSSPPAPAAQSVPAPGPGQVEDAREAKPKLEPDRVLAEIWLNEKDDNYDRL